MCVRSSLGAEAGAGKGALVKRLIVSTPGIVARAFAACLLAASKRLPPPVGARACMLAEVSSTSATLPP